MVFYCTADDTVPLDPVDWSALPKAARAACPSHVVRSGNGPRVAPNRAATAAELAECAAILAAAGHDIDAKTAAGEPLRCPVCLAPLRASATAETWTPPEGLPADPVPVPTVRPIQGTTVLPGSAEVTSSDWQPIAGTRTEAGAWASDVSRTLAGAVGGASVVGGGVELRLVEDALDGSPVRVLATKTLTEGEHPRFVAISAGPPAGAWCAYRIEARLAGATSATLAEVSIALYEVQP